MEWFTEWLGCEGELIECATRWLGNVRRIGKSKTCPSWWSMECVTEWLGNVRGARLRGAHNDRTLKQNAERTTPHT